MSTYSEPIHGWTDNLNGISGLALGIGVGFVRSIPINMKARVEVVPVDLCCNSMICSAWDIANRQDKDPQIYNYVTSSENALTWNDVARGHFVHTRKYNIQTGIWHFTLTLSPSNVFIFNIMNFFLHIIPSILMDTVLVAIMKKPM